MIRMILIGINRGNLIEVDSYLFVFKSKVLMDSEDYKVKDIT